MTVATQTTTLERPLLTDTQVRRLLRLPDARRRHGRRDRAMLAILTGGGLRIGELVSLRVQDLERGPGGTVILRFRTLKRKDGSRRAVVLGPRFARPVLDYMRNADLRWWLLPGQRGEALNVRSARRLVKGYLERLGRPDFRCHDLRHQATTMLLRASGGNAWAVAKMLGWRNLRQLENRYGHYIDRDGLALAAQLEEWLARAGRPVSVRIS